MHSLKEIDDFQFHFLRGMMLSVEPDESEGEAFSLWDVTEIAVLSVCFPYLSLYPISVHSVLEASLRH